MHFVNLNSCKSLSDAEAVAENWYARLNNLKQWLEDNPDHYKRYKAADLAATMAVRVMGLAQILKAAATPLPNYPAGTAPGKGGVAIVGERGEETITFKDRLYRHN